MNILYSEWNKALAHYEMENGGGAGYFPSNIKGKPTSFSADHPVGYVDGVSN